MSFLDSFQFVSQDSAVHRLDPRVKFAISVSILLSALLYVSFIISAFLLLLSAFLATMGRVERRWVRSLRAAIPLALLLFIISLVTLYLRPSGTSLTEILGESSKLSLRLVVFLSSFSIFFLTTTPEELSLTLTSWRMPYTFTFAFVSAVRFTPVLAEELRSIMDAQKSRGLELEKGSFLVRLRRLVPVIIPLLINSIRRSYEVAEALEVKCFGASKKRTSLKELKMSGRDYAVLVSVLAVFSALLYIRLSPLALLIP